MCGICGMIDLRGANRANPNLVRQMTTLIQHRGPDGDGFHNAPNVALGMRRLSIIDVRGSDQPLYSADRSLVLVFNGEIYNYRELRDDLQRQGYAFYTQGDGETLIHLYERDGLGMFQHLRGMYAFALYDRTQERLIVATDHIGMKPVYLYEHDGILQFASEVKCFTADDGFTARLNLPALDTSLTFGFPVGEQTLFAGLKRLMPGHVLIAEHGHTRIQRHWHFGEHPKPSPTTLEAATERARDLLRQSVRLHLRSDVPLGLFLSGGVDSAAILALMSLEETQTIQTFTVGYAAATPDNELIHARRIAEHFKTDHHERIITAADWWEGFACYIYHEDEPTANASAVSLLLLAEETAKSVRVVLTGLGGDELFGGYPHHHNIPLLLRRQAHWSGWQKALGGLSVGLEPHYPAFKRYRGLGALPSMLPPLRWVGLPRDEALRRAFSFDGMVLTDSLRERLYRPALQQHLAVKDAVYSAIIGDSWRTDPHQTAQALVINTWLHGNALLHTDKVTMAYSLEARVPLFDPALLDFAAGLDPQLWSRANKIVLREAMRPHLPAFALARPKQPFSTPIRGWFAHELREPIGDMLLNPSARVYDLFEKDALRRVVQDHFSGAAKHEELIFRLLTLEAWLTRFGVAAG